VNAFTKALVSGGVVCALAALPIAFAQNTSQQPTLDARVRQLEISLSSLASQVSVRTDVGSGPDDRMMRDINLDTRLGNIERQVQQVNNSVMELQRQISDAVRAASQAQSDAMLAQQIARDAQARIN
jgi:gas vesicle protein